jgi:hypothetical protein
MSFDIAPDDKYERFLLKHDESDCIFEVFSKHERDKYIEQDQCEDVTGIEFFESSFKVQQGN